MISGYCATHGKAGDPLGLLVDSTGALVCFWCKRSDRPSPPATLAPAWVVGDDDYTALTCEDHAREYAADNGLVWAYPGSTLESARGYAYAVVFSGDLESDHPQACERFHCGTYLDTRLTPDGVEYVRENYSREWWTLWGVTA
jgi:hypothetical protein